MTSFNAGPFTFSPGRALRVAGASSKIWTLSYGPQGLAERTLPATATNGEVREAFAAAISSFAHEMQREHGPERVYLIDFETGDAVGGFDTLGVPDMTPGLIDDRSRYWLRSENRLRSRPVTLSQFAELAAQHAAPPTAWIAGLLPDDMLATDPAEWRAPTNWEIRHIVGEGSFTGISGAKAAELVGVTPQNFRKYTAADSASTRQKMSFAMWHLLLHKLGVQRA